MIRHFTFSIKGLHLIHAMEFLPIYLMYKLATFITVREENRVHKRTHHAYIFQ
jgi:hypothetical protein